VSSAETARYPLLPRGCGEGGETTRWLKSLSQRARESPASVSSYALGVAGSSLTAVTAAAACAASCVPLMRAAVRGGGVRTGSPTDASNLASVASRLASEAGATP
jgi:hypothetical protein